MPKRFCLQGGYVRPAKVTHPVFLLVFTYFCTMNSKPQIDYDEDVLLLEETTDVRDLIVYNDDINTFDHVIKTLIDVCGHEPEQAEQCTLLIHYKGQCTVKHGVYDELAAMCTAIHDRGISADVL